MQVILVVLVALGVIMLISKFKSNRKFDKEGNIVWKNVPVTPTKEAALLAAQLTSFISYLKENSAVNENDFKRVYNKYPNSMNVIQDLVDARIKTQSRRANIRILNVASEKYPWLKNCLEELNVVYKRNN